MSHQRSACAGVLYTVAPKLLLALLVYSVFGTWFTASAFGKQLMRLQYRQLQNEGDLRFDLVRTRENAGGAGGEQCMAVTRHRCWSNTACLAMHLQDPCHLYWQP